MDTTRWITLGLGGGLLVLHALQQSRLGIFIDPPTAILVVGGGALVGLGGVGRRWRALPAVLGAADPAPEACQEAAEVVQTLRRSVWLVALLATLMGATQLLQGLGDPSSVAPVLARAPLALSYALLTDIFVFTPLRGGLHGRGAVRREAAETGAPADCGPCMEGLG